jgi:predicted nucleotidyltransferase
MDIELLKAIVSRYPQINAAYLYGSAAAGKLRPNSDIDVALLLAEPFDSAEMAALQTRVISDIEAAFHREADVKILNTLEHLPIGLLLVDREPALRRAFTVRKNREYLDYLPHYQRILDSYAERLKQRGRQKSGFDENHPDSPKPGENSNVRASEPR